MKTTKTIKKEAAMILREGNWFPAVGAFFVSLLGAIASSYLVSLILTLLSPLLNFLSDRFINNVLPIITNEMSQRETNTLKELIPYLTMGLGYLILIIPFMILLMPLFMGSVKYARSIAYNGFTPFSEVFCYFRKGYSGALRVGTSITFSCLIRIFLSFIPVSLVKNLLISLGLFDNTLDFSSALCYVILCVLIYLSTLLSARLCLKFLFPLFSYLENGNTKIRESLSLREFMPADKSNLPFKLFFSLSLWIMLCYFVIPVIFVLPYVLMCFFVLQKSFYDDNEKNKDE